MTRAANKALGHNRINLSEGLRLRYLTAKISPENIKREREETSRTRTKIGKLGLVKKNPQVQSRWRQGDIVDNSHVFESKKGTEAQNCGGLLLG